MRYLFFVAWFKAREKKLADQIDFDRMIGAFSLEESFKVLNDTDYAPCISNKSYLDIEEIIDQERNSLRLMLSKMGMDKQLLSIIFLKQDLMDSIKNKESSDQEINQEIKKRDLSEVNEIYDLIYEIYFKKLISFCKKTKENKAVLFFDEYWHKLEKENDIQKRDAVLVEMESEIIDQSQNLTSGILPILAFFIRKKRIENFIRNIFSAKRIGFSSNDIYKIMTPQRTL